MGSSASMSSQEDVNKDTEQTEDTANETNQEHNTEGDDKEECFLEAKESKQKHDSKKDNVDYTKQRESVSVTDQSVDVQEFIIAVKVDDQSFRDDVAKFEISDMSPNEILRQKEEQKRQVELDKLMVAKRKREEEIYKEERLISLRNQLDARYSIIDKYQEDKMEVSQSVIDNLSSLVKKFHTHKQCERDIPALAKRHPVLEKKLRRRKQQKEHLQTKHIQATPSRLKQTNPDIAELSSTVRAMKLASQLSTLYDQERKACFTEIRQRARLDIPNSSIHMCLRDLFLFCFKRCRAMSDLQTKSIMSSLTLMETTGQQSAGGETDTYIDKINALACNLLVKEFQKNVSKWCLARLKKESLLEISQIQAFNLVTKTLRAPPYRPPLNHYLDRSTDISWFSQLHNPILTIVYNREPKFHTMYRPFNTEGSNISYVVWPTMLESDLVLVKGVAMFDNKAVTKQPLQRVPQRAPRIVST